MPPPNNTNIFEVPIEQMRSLQFRVVITAAVLVGLVLILIGRLAYLQIISHQDFVALSTDNRVQVVPVTPIRGSIYDKKGHLLAGNETAYRLAITAKYVEDMDALIKQIQEIVSISDTDLTKFKRSSRFSSKHNAVVLKDYLLPEEMAKIAVERHKLPGVSIVTDLHRVYVDSIYTSHVVGTLSQIDKQDQEQLDPIRYRGIRYVGKSGIEQATENMLVGSSGHDQIETNAHGRKIRVLSHVAPIAGHDVHLTIDRDLQKLAYEALGDEVGALVAIEPSTGRILAMVSKPSFNSNQFGIGGEQEERSELLTSESRPLLNRSIQGQYPPGSTIKPFLAFAALEAGYASRIINCPGWYKLPNYSRKFRCWKEHGHGPMTLFDAIAESCDVYFYVLARELGIDEMYYQLSKFGFGTPTGVELLYESPGILPSKEWKQWTKQEPWYPGETLITGIGQGATVVSMLQLAHATATIANKGKKYRPQLILKTVDGMGHVNIHEPELLEEIDFKKQYFDWVKEAMEEVVHGERGTARKIKEDISYRMAGKTGTVQVISRSQSVAELDLEKTAKKHHPHGIFTVFAPADDPKIALAVIVENGVAGSAIAPIARTVLDYYLQSDSDSNQPEGDSFALVPSG